MCLVSHAQSQFQSARNGVHVVPSRLLGTDDTMLKMDQARLLLQMSLLGEVSPSLRGVTVRISDGSIHFDAYYDGPISDDDAESMSCVETELIASLPEDYIVTYALQRLDWPSVLPKIDFYGHCSKETGRYAARAL